MPRVSIIAALSQYDNAIGKDNDLLWHLPADLKRFKQLTIGHPIIMGRKTFESIGRPLPGRDNIVITRNTDYTQDGVILVHSLKEALDIAQEKDQQEVFVIGGGQIYEQALPLADRLYLTFVDVKDEDADIFFPDYKDFNKEISRKSGEDEGIKYTWVTLEKGS